MLSSIKLTNFRGFDSVGLSLRDHLTVLVGDNAQGKTNFLRAIEMLGLGDPRAVADGALLRFGSDAGCVEGHLESAGGCDRLVAGLSNRGVRLSLNGKATTRPRWVGRLPVLFTGPEDREQVMGPPSARRALLDEMLEQCDPTYLSALRDYRRALKQRNRVLARGEVVLPEEVEIWDEPLALAGGVLLAARVDAVAALAPRATAWHRELTGSAACLTVKYESGVPEPEARGSAAAWAESLKASLDAMRSRETAWGATLTGPHRDDVGISLNGRALKGVGSSGEVWSAILAFTLASAEHLGRSLGCLPLLLLDDVMAALDDSRRDRLLGVLRGLPQSFLTTTSCPEGCGAQAIYRVCQHQLTASGQEEAAATSWHQQN